MARRARILLLPIAVATCALVNPGNFGTIDTARRLQVARWIRLGEAPVRPEDRAAGFGITGRNGVLHAWYGIGQSLMLIPFDAVVSTGAKPLLARAGLDPVKQEQIIELVIAFLMQSAITACSLLIAYQVLLLFDLSMQAAMAGTLSLLLGTLFLQYVQSAQENNLLLLLALCALFSILRFQRADSAKWAVAAGAACGFAILVRLPSVLETCALLAFALGTSKRRLQFVAGYLPPIVAALALDRWYHWYRFGELFSTYMGVFGRQYRPDGAPASFPFSYPFWKGFLGTFDSADKSIFLFDPLLTVVILVLIWRWRNIHRRLRLLVICLAALLVAYISVYAKYFDFGGDAAWGHRFVTLPVELLCLFAVPLLIEAREDLPSWHRRIVWALVFIAVAIQAISTTISPNLEILQRERGSHNGVITNRIANLAQMASGHESARFDGVPIEWKSLYYFPFQLRFRYPELAKWAIAGWLILLAALAIMVAQALRGATEPVS